MLSETGDMWRGNVVLSETGDISCGCGEGM